MIDMRVVARTGNSLWIVPANPVTSSSMVFFLILMRGANAQTGRPVGDWGHMGASKSEGALNRKALIIGTPKGTSAGFGPPAEIIISAPY